MLTELINYFSFIIILNYGHYYSNLLCSEFMNFLISNNSP